MSFDRGTDCHSLTDAVLSLTGKQEGNLPLKDLQIEPASSKSNSVFYLLASNADRKPHLRSSGSSSRTPRRVAHTTGSMISRHLPIVDARHFYMILRATASESHQNGILLIIIVFIVFIATIRRLSGGGPSILMPLCVQRRTNRRSILPT